MAFPNCSPGKNAQKIAATLSRQSVKICPGTAATTTVFLLTALTAVTIPPVVIGSWYGMNFRHMPELSHPSAYYGLMGITLAMMLGMGLWLKFKRWF